MTTEIKYCPNPDECDGNCKPLQEVVQDIDSKLNNVLNFIVSFFEDDDNVQPIKDELQFCIDELKYSTDQYLRLKHVLTNLKQKG